MSLMQFFKRIGPVSLLILLLVFSCSAFTLSSVKASAQTASSADQIVTLKTGFNFVSFTVTPPATPAELISKNSNIEDIYLYSAAAGSFLSVSEGSLSTLAIGKGYIIKSKADTSITINGPPAATIGDITLKKGFNLLGVSKLSSAAAVNSFTKLLNASSSIGGLYKWSPAAGSFLQVIRDTQDRPIMIDGSDPSLKPGEAYFVNALEDTKISYDEDIKLQKLLAGVITSPTSDSVAAGGTYDLSKLKVYAVYSDGSTVEVTAAATFAANIGKLSGMVYTAPKYSAMAVITVSYTDPVLNASKDGYFMLAVTSSGVTPVKTTNYKCTYKLAPKAKVIDEESVVTVSVADAQVVLSVANESDAPKAGDILIGYYGEGYLRKAVSVSVQNGQAVVTTGAANLEDAFESLNYSYKGKLSTLQAADAPVMAPGSVEDRAVKRFLRSKRVFSAPAPDRGIISKDKLTKILNHAKLMITLTKADITFDPVVEVDMVVEWFTLHYFRFIVGGDMTIDIEFKIDAIVASDNSLKFEYPLYHSAPYVFMAGPVPCSFEWNINLDNASQVYVTGSYLYSSHLSQYVRMGAMYCGGEWEIINDRIAESSAKDDYQLKGGIRMRPNLNIGFALKVAGVAGPKIILEAFLFYVAEMSKPNIVDITVTGGFAARVSFILEVLSWKIAEFRAELASKSWPIYKKTLDFNIYDPVISPGGGSYSEDQTVSITCANKDAYIHYTVDGSTPSYEVGILYTAPIKVSKSMTIKAIAYKNVYTCSNVVTADFAIRDIYIPSDTPASAFTCRVVELCPLHYKEYCSECTTKEEFAELTVSWNNAPKAITVPATYTYEDKILKVAIVHMSNNNVEAVKISDGINKVEFPGNTGLKKIVLPLSVEYFRLSACTALYDFTYNWPASFTELSWSNFNGCTSLSTLELPKSLKKIGQEALGGTGLVKLVIPGSVESMDTNACGGMIKLEEVVLSAAVKIIPHGAFNSCTSLSKINLDNVVEIKDYAFDRTRIPKFTFGPSLKTIGYNAIRNYGEEYYFEGDAPSFGKEPFGDGSECIAHSISSYNSPDGSVKIKIHYKLSSSGWTEAIKTCNDYYASKPYFKNPFEFVQY